MGRAAAAVGRAATLGMGRLAAVALAVAELAVAGLAVAEKAQG